MAGATSRLSGNRKLQPRKRCRIQKVEQKSICLYIHLDGFDLCGEPIEVLNQNDVKANELEFPTD